MLMHVQNLVILLFIYISCEVNAGYYPEGGIGFAGGQIGPIANYPIYTGVIGGPLGVGAGVGVGIGSGIGSSNGVNGVSGGYTKKYTNVVGGSNVGALGNYAGGLQPLHTTGYVGGGYPGAFGQAIAPVGLGGQFKGPYVHGAGYGGYILPHGLNTIGNGYNNIGVGYNTVGAGYNNVGAGYNNVGAGYNNVGGGYNNLGGGGVGIAGNPGLIGAAHIGGYHPGALIRPVGPPITNGLITPLAHHGHGSVGGEYVDKKGFSGENKNANNVAYEKSGGNQGQLSEHGAEGFNQGKQAHKDGKSDSGYYNAESGGKKVSEDGKNYNGKEQFNQQGKSELENKEQKSHKKGHKIHEFKNYHKKDESGNTEEYFDEEHDEGDHFNVIGKAGAFGQNAGSAYKGGHLDGHFNNGQKGNQGHHNNQHYVDKSNGGSGKFDENKFNKNSQNYGVNSGGNQQSFDGHNGATSFYKHHPFHHHQFY